MHFLICIVYYVTVTCYVYGSLYGKIESTRSALPFSPPSCPPIFPHTKLLRVPALVPGVVYNV